MIVHCCLIVGIYTRCFAPRVDRSTLQYGDAFNAPAPVTRRDVDDGLGTVTLTSTGPTFTSTVTVADAPGAVLALQGETTAAPEGVQLTTVVLTQTTVTATTTVPVIHHPGPSGTDVSPQGGNATTAKPTTAESSMPVMVDTTCTTNSTSAPAPTSESISTTADAISYTSVSFTYAPTTTHTKHNHTGTHEHTPSSTPCSTTLTLTLSSPTPHTIATYSPSASTCSTTITNEVTQQSTATSAKIVTDMALTSTISASSISASLYGEPEATNAPLGDTNTNGGVRSGVSGKKAVGVTLGALVGVAGVMWGL